MQFVNVGEGYHLFPSASYYLLRRHSEKERSIMDRKALITFQATFWSGWDRDGYSIVTSAQLWVAKGRALTPETLGNRRSDYAEVPNLFYEVLVETIVQDRVGFAYRNLVMKNPGGTVNLSAAQSGRFILGPGTSMMLATPTLDAGTSVTVTLDEIR